MEVLAISLSTCKNGPLNPLLGCLKGALLTNVGPMKGVRGARTAGRDERAGW